ncbi:hypothetical protein [Clostridium saccharobutylicum]|uniref:Uncharacterized protein n=1 Tax=Clostridium saccharobutylicum DSM 13864 TaxID=1345695 RepID=U5MS89_CLOSA|nr:hypothetical protein [Clostridium saccharobutylicum]AGX43674.1 hypothetical protein CLSA_c27030 [Clostridium saccharobutylicum DSM 13864]AQR90972.1 hypothetical protein CLOSC_26930 [Clostridium saccharobutylicum]AQS00876.1 hypothetical protein CSACC_27000 [Clostridium saccharobutylicum]AQS14859.1 hypothetical protein CLOSACC_27000 [Clostridium saccharobutylicum]MBA2907098.1 hypothetical protein [Clostridium saccharobutylicum]
MRKSITILKRNSFIHKNKEYEFDRIDEIINSLKKDRKIIILEEELYAKHFDFKEKNRFKINHFVDEKIKNEFPQNGDIVYDYDKKGNVISIYSMKGGERINKISEGAKNIDVIPIQFIIKEVMIKTFNNKILNCNILTNFNGCYYYISFKNGLYYCGFVEKSKEMIFNKIVENHDIAKIYIDNISQYEFLEQKYQIIKMNMGDLINDRIYEK